jgi:hypothetical protein
MPSPTPDPLAGIRSKIERAKKHVSDLEVAIRAFLDSGPYKVGTKRDPDTRKLIYYVTHVKDVPTDVTQIAGDAIGNMVSILDHLAFRLYKKHTPAGDGRHVYFPIAKNARNAAVYVTERERKVKGIEPTVVIPALDALEPYKGGKGHQLWVLNELNNLAKHRELIAVGSRFRSMDLGAVVMPLLEKLIGQALPDIPAFFRPADPLCPLKVGDEIFIDAPDAELNPKIKFAFDVALNEPQIIQAEPLIETVHQLADLVDSIVGQFAKYL